MVLTDDDAMVCKNSYDHETENRLSEEFVLRCRTRKSNKINMKGGEEMDFLTGLAYWGMAVLVIINTIIVAKMKINIGDK